jgi:hypothetical protein
MSTMRGSLQDSGSYGQALQRDSALGELEFFEGGRRILVRLPAIDIRDTGGDFGRTCSA